jgi:hypothetical protein
LSESDPVSANLGLFWIRKSNVGEFLQLSLFSFSQKSSVLPRVLQKKATCTKCYKTNTPGQKGRRLNALN